MSAAAALRPLLVAALAAVVLAGCAGVQVARSPSMHPGQELFNGYVKDEGNCYKCHNGDGRGTKVGPPLTTVAKLRDKDILEYINDGEGIMPSFADKLSEDEKQLIVAWLRQEFGAPAD
jgi:mono/diheme cytochrome c family protein